MILLNEIVEILATPHLNVLPLQILSPQTPKRQVAEAGRAFDQVRRYRFS